MKKLGKIAAFVFAVGFALCLTVPAFAADGPAVNKTLNLNEGSKVNATFSYNVEAIEINTDKEGVKTSTDGPLPTIADITLKDGNLTGSSKIVYGEFTHPGYYAWKISEKADTYTGQGTMQYDTQVYTLITTVVNAPEGGYKVDSSVIVKGLADKTTNAENLKVESLDFTNSFVDFNYLTIGKEVQGNLGDKNMLFDFTITFTAPTVLPTGKTAADVLNGIDAIPTNKAEIIDFGTVSEDATTRTITFKASDSQFVTFDKVLVGTKYDITEAAVNPYKSSWTAVANGENTTSQTAVLIGQAENKGTMTNTYEGTPTTGLLVNSTPFIMLGVVAVAGVVAYGVAKRKLEQ